MQDAAVLDIPSELPEYPPIVVGPRRTVGRPVVDTPAELRCWSSAQRDSRRCSALPREGPVIWRIHTHVFDRVIVDISEGAALAAGSIRIINQRSDCRRNRLNMLNSVDERG